MNRPGPSTKLWPFGPLQRIAVAMAAQRNGPAWMEWPGRRFVEVCGGLVRHAGQAWIEPSFLIVTVIQGFFVMQSAYVPSFPVLAVETSHETYEGVFVWNH